mmetsp:Transcript_78712/g.248813  ORF Transcript_78712/g.248813 Transcript_78712/m.248813 type:complete len:220 (-) Transcript_78712:242-901(-)
MALRLRVPGAAPADPQRQRRAAVHTGDGHLHEGAANVRERNDWRRRRQAAGVAQGGADEGLVGLGLDLAEDGAAEYPPDHLQVTAVRMCRGDGRLQSGGREPRLQEALAPHRGRVEPHAVGAFELALPRRRDGRRRGSGGALEGRGGLLRRRRLHRRTSAAAGEGTLRRRPARRAPSRGSARPGRPPAPRGARRGSPRGARSPRGPSPGPSTPAARWPA